MPSASGGCGKLSVQLPPSIHPYGVSSTKSKIYSIRVGKTEECNVNTFRTIRRVLGWKETFQSKEPFPFTPTLIYIIILNEIGSGNIEVADKHQTNMS